jgi:hypothetical protein
MGRWVLGMLAGRTEQSNDNGLRFLRLELFVFPAKTLDAACRIHEFLLPGIKRVALGTDFHADFLFRRSGGDFVAARTADHGLMVGWMNIVLHNAETSSVDSSNFQNIYYTRLNTISTQLNRNRSGEHDATFGEQ